MTDDVETPKRRGCPPGGWPKTGAKKYVRKRPDPVEQGRFSIDSLGTLQVLEPDLRTGVILDPVATVQLRDFLIRCLPITSTPQMG